MSQKNFAITPSVSISRSKFKRPSQHKTSFNLGDIVPIYVDADILPGDTVSLDIASLVRMSTPIAPIMDNIHIDYYAFFVPNRLVWGTAPSASVASQSWKAFMGENTNSYGAVSEPTFPVVSIAGSNSASSAGTVYHKLTVGCLGHYMGLPIIPNADSVTDENLFTVSALPGRAYILIYNEWFRDQNLIAPVSCSFTQGSNNVLRSDLYRMSLLKAAKDSDYFTRALPYAQKGSPVSLPLGTNAPVVVTNDIHNMGDVLKLSSNATTPITGSLHVTGDGVVYHSGTVTTTAPIQYSNMVADLSSATAATINDLRFAFQYQKFLEKDALYGTRYWEILKGHFGITAPDASLQRPELLGHWRQHVNVDQVLSTAGYSASSSTTVGAPGANSVTGGKSSLFTKSFVEHGCLMILAVARHDQTYSQGINRMWLRKHRTDFYFPVFANLGAQEIKNKEIYCDESYADQPFGFQEAWAEYRYKPSIASGLMDPSQSGSLGFWTLTNNFAAQPTLSQSFIEQDRDALSRALVTGSTGPDFIADFFFDATYVRPMPMYSIPGLIDHH